MARSRMPGALILLFVIGTPALAPAQQSTGAEREALAAVEKLFDAMRAGDSATFRSLFVPDALLGSVGAPRGGGPVTFTKDSLGRFVAGIPGSRPPNVYDERIANPKVLVDSDLAMVWVEYTFYVGERKSHCGVDVFQLVRQTDGWKIFALADTRRRENCPDLERGK